MVAALITDTPLSDCPSSPHFAGKWHNKQEIKTLPSKEIIYLKSSLPFRLMRMPRSRQNREIRVKSFLLVNIFIEIFRGSGVLINSACFWPFIAREDNYTTDGQKFASITEMGFQ
jgi:hypothetical protein